ncbi:carboxylesterase/lipase family protein [Hyphococcus luteus]|uniref:Carboxylic ester hydrolase n=1 Tax=Hyphococcus luteus TaxID=2058213 RepID=A0A2S7KAN3_9PROT|nr:carboxylesterase family protein [Marinicaulis flavus]PQA89580.1 carboxylesterase [Marinicaulis flavus]
MSFFSRLAAAALLAANIACAHAGDGGQGGVLVKAPAGKVRGVAEEGVQAFKGIPYAAAPVGNRRWKPPAPAEQWEGAFDAGAFGPACMQYRANKDSIYDENVSAYSEDCLSLNIWKPKDAQNAPVFVWIHGGALRSGASGVSMYDGAAFAKRGVIFVSINYRLGILGYLAHPELSAESPDGVSGNYGLLDQIAALEWVQRNIGAFGGDPDNVTIAGESAGALSVMYLMASPPARGLFDKAVAQSAYMISTPSLKEQRYGMPAAEAVGLYVADKLEAEDIAALREMDAFSLTKKSLKTGYAAWGTVDGVVLSDELVNMFDRGEQAPVPILAGFNSGEIRSLRALLPKPPKNADAYEAEIRARYGELAEAFLKQYPPKNIEESMLATTRDAMYGWTAERLVRKQTEIGAEGYLYIFDHGYPAANEMGLHAFHASEIPYALGTIDKATPNWPDIPDTDREQEMSDAMVGYWTSFARDGEPSAQGYPSWRPYSSDEAYMYFADAPEGRATHLLPGMFELHEEVMCRRRAAGDIPWTWNVGVASPPLPPQAPGCR